MIRIARFFFLWLILCFANKLQAQAVLQVEVHVKPQQIALGALAEVAFKIQYNSEQFQLKPLQIPDTIGALEKMGKIVSETKSENNTQIDYIRFALTAYDSGRYNLPPMALVFAVVGKDRDTIVYTPSIPIQVIAPTVDTSQAFKPIQPIEEAVMPWQEQLKTYVLYGLYAIIGLALMYILYRVLKRNEKKENTIPQRRVSPYEKALFSLEALDKEVEIPAQGEKQFYTRLIDILREFLEEAQGISCFDKTSSVILADIAQNDKLKPWQTILQHLLETGDAVKFAKSTTRADIRKQNIVRLRRIVEDLSPQKTVNTISG